jgi:protein O-mannosyl-transferase
MTRWSTIPVAVAIISAACFLPAASGSFLNWDDPVNFQDNTAYRGLGWEQIRWAFTSVVFGHYIPLTRLSWSLNYVLGGLDPRGYHLVNLLLHSINVGVFYLIARRLLTSAFHDGAQQDRYRSELCAGAGVAALVFGMHPLRVEPVAWVSGRGDLLSATFSLLAVLAYLRAVERDGRARHSLIGVSTAAFVAALLSKGSALPLPVAFVLLDVYPLRRVTRVGWRIVVQEKIPLLLAMVAGAVAIVWAVRSGAALIPSWELGAVARLSVAAYSLLASIARFVWPAWLSPLYEMPARVSLESRFGLALVAVALVTAALVALRRRWPAGLIVWAFAALMLGPASTAVRVTADLAPDRYTYLSGLGFSLLVGGVVVIAIDLLGRGIIKRSLGYGVALAGLTAIASLAVASWSLAGIWTESETLWRWSLEVDPTCSICHGKLGETALSGPAGTRRAAEAEALFRRAIALRPDLPDAYYNLASALVVQGRDGEVMPLLQRYMERVPLPVLRSALSRDPDAPGLREELVQALRHQAATLQARGLRSEAEALLAEARTLQPAPALKP